LRSHFRNRAARAASGRSVRHGERASSCACPTAAGAGKSSPQHDPDRVQKLGKASSFNFSLDPMIISSLPNIAVARAQTAADSAATIAELLFNEGRDGEPAQLRFATRRKIRTCKQVAIAYLERLTGETRWSFAFAMLFGKKTFAKLREMASMM